MWYNPIIKSILKSPLNWLVSNGMLLLTYTGQKSGQTYEVPVSYVELEDEDGRLVLLTISKASRTWWRNFRQETPVTLRLRGRDRQAQAQAFSGEEAILNLNIYLSHATAVAQSLDVRLDTDKAPLTEDVQKLSENWVIVRFNLE